MIVVFNRGEDDDDDNDDDDGGGGGGGVVVVVTTMMTVQSSHWCDDSAMARKKRAKSITLNSLSATNQTAKRKQRLRMMNLNEEVQGWGLRVETLRPTRVYG